MKVSIIIPVKGRLEHLKQVLPTVLKQSHTDFEVIIVDYNCPDKTFEYVRENFNDERIVLCKANVKENEWSLSAARNYGFKQSDPNAPVVLFLDADAMLGEDFLKEALLRLVDGSFMNGWGFGDGTGCCLMWRRDFVSINGYNEELKSWGWEDIELYKRLEDNLHIEMRSFPCCLETIKHGDEIRNAFHGGLPVNITNTINQKISQKKFKGLV